MRPKQRIANASRLLGQMIATAKANFKAPEQVRFAVMLSWVGLAGLTGATPEMWAQLEQEMRKA